MAAGGTGLAPILAMLEALDGRQPAVGPLRRGFGGAPVRARPPGCERRGGAHRRGGAGRKPVLPYGLRHRADRPACGRHGRLCLRAAGDDRGRPRTAPGRRHRGGAHSLRTLPAELRQAGRRPLAALALSAALALAPLSAAQPETPPPLRRGVDRRRRARRRQHRLYRHGPRWRRRAGVAAGGRSLPARLDRQDRDRRRGARDPGRRAPLRDEPPAFPATGSTWWAAATRCSPWRT